MLHRNHLPHAIPGEKTILFLRRHWTGPLQLVGITLVAGIAPIIVLWLLGQVTPGVFDIPVADAAGAAFVSIYYLSVATFFFQEFIDYYLDTWIVTTERVINIEQKGLFNRIASEMHISLVQDVSAATRGMLQTFLNYGDVYVQSAGEMKRFHFKSIPNPEGVRVAILRLAEADRRKEHHVPPTH